MDASVVQDAQSATFDEVINSMYFPGAGLNFLEFDDQSSIDYTTLSSSSSDFGSPISQLLRTYDNEEEL